jgi:hypothetical protein
MRNFKSTLVSLLLVVGLVTASLLLTGCPKKKGLREGAVYLAVVEPLGERGLYAHYLEGMDHDDKLREYLERLQRACEEGDEEACEELEQAREKLDGDRDRGFGFYTQVDSVDPEAGSFVVFDELVVVMAEAEDEDPDALSTTSTAQDPDEGDDDKEDYEQVGIDELVAGDWVKAIGRCDDDGVFHAEMLFPVEEGRHMIWAELWDLTDSSFTMLGLEIAYDSETKIDSKKHDKGSKDRPR